MSNQFFEITKEQQIAATLSFLSHAGQKIVETGVNRGAVDKKIHDMLECAMPQMEPLHNDAGQLDWQIVWGPVTYTFPNAKYQDNMMYVVQSISDPTRYAVAIRGTNGVADLDWLREDFAVFRKEAWKLPKGKKVKGKPVISHASMVGLDALLKHLIPAKGLPGEGQNIAAFMKSITQPNPVSILITGHSLAGALCEVLGLWFRQSQGLSDEWDPNTNATLSVISFAGATPGNVAFANYFNEQFGSACQRIHNEHDVVPHAWENKTLAELPQLYAGAGIKMSWSQWLAAKTLRLVVHGYQQVAVSYPFTWPLNTDPKYNKYLAQAGHQHSYAYQAFFKIPHVEQVIAECEKKVNGSSS
ncbi:MAG: hypothetical protein AAF639_21505 [Chloroflexota bacterium]